MKNKKIIIGVFVVVLIAVIATVVLLLPKKDSGVTKYTIITDSKFITMQNDGGSHINIYYEVNVKSGEIKKLADSYVGFQGYEYEGKELYKKTIKGDILKELKKLLEDLVNEEDKSDDTHYSSYVIKYGDKQRDVYREDSVKALREILSKIDEYK